MCALSHRQPNHLALSMRVGGEGDHRSQRFFRDCRSTIRSRRSRFSLPWWNRRNPALAACLVNCSYCTPHVHWYIYVRCIICSCSGWGRIMWGELEADQSDCSPAEPIKGRVSFSFQPFFGDISRTLRLALSSWYYSSRLTGTIRRDFSRQMLQSYSCDFPPSRVRAG